MAAFAFAKFNFKGKIVIWALVMLSFMIPFEVISIPLYSLVNSMGWVDTYKGLIIPGIANGLVIFLFRQFFYGLTGFFIGIGKNGRGFLVDDLYEDHHAAL